MYLVRFTINTNTYNKLVYCVMLLTQNVTSTWKFKKKNQNNYVLIIKINNLNIKFYEIIFKNLIIKLYFKNY